VMTPEYASTEQVRGNPVSTATDIYSPGVLCGENHPAKTNRCSSIQAHVAGKSRPGSRARDR